MCNCAAADSGSATAECTFHMLAVPESASHGDFGRLRQKVNEQPYNTSHVHKSRNLKVGVILFERDSLQYRLYATDLHLSNACNSLMVAFE